MDIEELQNNKYGYPYEHIFIYKYPILKKSRIYYFSSYIRINTFLDFDVEKFAEKFKTILCTDFLTQQQTNIFVKK